MNILHFTSILPAPIERKKDENDIIIRIAQEYEKKYPIDKHYFVLFIPYSNFIFSLVNKRWNGYYKLIKKGYYEYNGINVFVIGMPAFKSDRRIRIILNRIGYYINRKQLLFILNRIKPDIIHAHNLSNNIEIATILSKKFNIELIATAREINFSIINRINNNTVNLKALISINQHIFNKYNDSISIPFKVIPHPIDEEFFVNEVKMQPHNNFVNFISVGRLLDSKNYDKVLLALSNVKINYLYQIYGEGPERENLSRLIVKLNLQEKVQLKGAVTHGAIKLALQRQDLFLMPSYPETLGRVFFEAMASGVPVIASKDTGIDGLIIDGCEGYLVNHLKIEDIQNKLLTFINLNDDEKLKMKILAFRNASKYRWNSTLEKYFQIYHS